MNLARVKKRTAYSGQLDDESACIILEQFFASGGFSEAEVVTRDASVVEEAEAAEARATAAAALKEEHDEARRRDEDVEVPRVPEDAYDMMGERWVPRHFDIDAFDLEGEIARRAAALDEPTSP